MDTFVFSAWVVVEKSQKETYELAGFVGIEDVSPGRYYIGLRERLLDAVQRAQLIHGSPVTKESHILLKVKLSSEGFAHYATLALGVDYSHSPVLFKMVYKDRCAGWKVWHFQADLPLRAESPSGKVLLVSEWVEIPE